MLIDLTTMVPSNSPLLENAKDFAATGHIGTHLDTYEKTPIPLAYFRSPGVVFDVRGFDEVQMENIDLHRIPPQSFVLFYTGRIEEHPYGTPGYGKDHPQLSHDLINKLIEKRIRFIGVDCQGIRRHEEHTPADRFCEKNGVYVIENLQNLGQLKGDFTVYTMWLDDPELTGLRCRVIAEL
ncbi:MAG: cyclase family protein [Firmicutes bacterium]|nr:cyclase family protein [Bacillota bacterium]